MSNERVFQKDLYGFPVSLTSDEQAERVRCYKKSKKRQARDWAFETAHRHIPSSVSHEDMKRRCRKGIPTELRPFVWMEISGASQKKAEYASSYFVSTATAPPPDEAHEGHLKQIDLDVPRTFPEHAFFKSRQGQRALAMTLRALAAHMPDIGYCQSLNYVAALLLLVLDHDPEDAFWVLVVLIESKLVPGTYDTSISGCLKEVRVLEGLLHRKMPAVSKHLRKRDVDLIAVVPQWFLSLFSQDFPFETTVRVFDALLFEGSKILHRVALAMFKLTELRLLQASDTMAAALSLRSAAHCMHDRDLIMRTAVRRVGALSQATIEKLRRSQQPDGLFASFLSRIRTTRKPAKTAPWQSLESAGIGGKELVGSGAQEGMIGTAKSSAMRPEMAALLPRRHSSAGLRTVQYMGNLDRRSVDMPPPVDLLASMGHIGILDANADASSAATSPRSVHHGHTVHSNSVDSHDPRTAQLMQVQAVLDHASIRREMEFTHAEAFNFTQVKVVKVAEAAKLSMRSPWLGEDETVEEDDTEEVAGAGWSSRGVSGNTQERRQAPHMSSLPTDLRMSDGSAGAGLRPRRTPSMHGDVRVLLAAADERAAAAAVRSSMMHDRSSGGTAGTEGSPMTYKLPFPPSHECPGRDCKICEKFGYGDGAGLHAVLREAAAESQIDDGERHTWRIEPVGEAVAAAGGSRISTQMPHAVRMGDHAVPAVAQEADVGQGLAETQFPSGFELDFRQFAPPQNTQHAPQQVFNQDASLLHLEGPNSGVPFDHQFILDSGTRNEHAKLQMQARSSEHGRDSEQERMLGGASASGTVDAYFGQGYPVGHHPQPASRRGTSGGFPLPPPSSGQMFSPPRIAQEHISSDHSNTGMHVGRDNTTVNAQPDRASSPNIGWASPKRPHNAYGSGIFPMPLAGGGAAMPGRRLPGNLVPGVVHGLMPIEALGVQGLQLPSPPSERVPADLPVLPEGEAVSHDTSELTCAALWPGSVNMPSSIRMGCFADGLFSHGSQGTAPPVSGFSDMWHTAQEEGFDNEGPGNGSVSHPSSLANSQPGQCGFPLRMCN